eukprot:COSAG02_NODE_39045_length_421_cov_1.605590_1_plen_43_part_10
MDTSVIISDQATIVHVSVGDFISQLTCHDPSVPKTSHCRFGDA